MNNFRALEYEHILRRIAALITGRRELGERIEERGALDGYAEAGYWNDFERDYREDSLYDIIIGILKALDVIRQKIERLELR